MNVSRIRTFAVLTLASAGVLLAFTADAQRGKPHKPPPAHTTKIEVSKDGGVAAPEPVKANPDAGIVEAKTLDGGTRVFRFGEMEVEGRLRSPQIVYFLRRVRAEFAAGDLGHRSFMGELSDTRRNNAF